MSSLSGNTPNPLAGYELEERLDEDQRQQLQAMLEGRDEVDMASVLDLVQLKLGQLEMQSEPLCLADLMHQVADEHAQEAQEKGVELVLRCDQGLPPQVLVDHVRLARLLDHLVRNAVRHTHRGEILLLAESREGAIAFEVQDSGAGMEADTQEALFKALELGDVWDAPGPGLAFCKGLADCLGGTMSFASEIGRGTTVRVELPLEPILNSPPQAAPNVSGYRVLTIARSRELRRALELQLQAWGIDFEGRPDPQSISPAEVFAGGYDLCFLDWDMPRGVVDFKDALWEASEDERPWLVTLCPHGDPMVAEILGAFSGDGHLQKPLSEQHLREQLEQLLPQREPRRSQASEAQAANQRILLVDDNVLNRRVGLRMLARLGFSVEEAGEGRAALELLARESFDLMLLDCHMPSLDGYSVASELRERENRLALAPLPIIGLTALDTPADERRALDAGMDRVLQKPLHLGSLETALLRTLGRLPQAG